MSKNRVLKIGLFGFGVVGEGIYQVLKKTPGLDAEIKKICIKNPDKSRNAPVELFTISADELLNDENINVIVELIDDANSAYSIVKKALLNGKSVVSANKKMIAEHLTELLDIQQNKEQLSLLYEAAVCGSIPVIRNLEEYFDNDLLQSFSGIVNGSTNFILTRMNDDGLNYETALKEAQELGFAESNPSLDVEGYDAVNKLAIVIKHAYGIDANPDEITRIGINKIHEFDTNYAKEKGYKIKLLAHASRNESQVNAFVLPGFVGNENKLYSVNKEFNGVVIGSSLADEQFLSGKGAGRFPTSSAVLSDIAALRYGYKYEYRKSLNKNPYELSGNTLLKIYCSFENNQVIDHQYFKDISEIFHSANRSYLVGNILLSNLKDLEEKYPNASIISLN
ncbi:MAG: homoserine dehydrogenase [Bacteroidia bacterium]